MAGYSFGTYLPPLFTRASAEVTVVTAREAADMRNAYEEANALVGP